MSRPTIRILAPADREALERFLAPHRASSMFLLGNLARAGLADEGERLQGSYSAAFSNGAMAGVAAHYRNGRMVLQAPRFAAALAPHAARASGRPVEGLLGPAAQVGAAAVALGLGRARYDSRQPLYTLDLADLDVPAPLAEGRVRARRAAPADTATLAAWRAAYSVETVGDDDTPALRERARTSVEEDVEAGAMWLLEAEAEGWAPVACSRFSATVGPMWQVGGVWTPPALRGRGYARAVVAGSLLAARADGAAQGVLFTAEENAAAQRAYRALGFREVGVYRILLA